MPGRRKSKRILSLMAWNLVVWISAAHPSRGIAAQVSTSAASDQQAQIEKGRQVVGQVCAACHTTILRMVQVHKQSAEQWRDTIYFMISRGAQVLPDEVEPVTAFLAATAGSGRQTATQASGGGRPGPGRADQQMPDGEGRAIFQQKCQQCHELATASTKMPSEEWSAVIARMLTYGTKVTSGDQQKLIGYLDGLAK
jgi:mono/diheme cytochrome c family protein